MAAEILLRIAGAVTLMAAADIGGRLRGALGETQGVPGGMVVLMATATVLLLWAGLALTIAGPGLWRIQPVPPRAWLPAHGPRPPLTKAKKPSNSAPSGMPGG